MARFTGHVRCSDLEGGVLQLEAEDGNIYELEGEVDEKFVGQRVAIEGSVDRNAMSFSMTGPRLMVRAVSSV